MCQVIRLGFVASSMVGRGERIAAGVRTDMFDRPPDTCRRQEAGLPLSRMPQTNTLRGRSVGQVRGPARSNLHPSLDRLVIAHASVQTPDTPASSVRAHDAPASLGVPR